MKGVREVAVHGVEAHKVVYRLGCERYSPAYELRLPAGGVNGRHGSYPWRNRPTSRK